MKIREENKLKDINEKRQQSINYVILESYNVIRKILFLNNIIFFISNNFK